MNTSEPLRTSQETPQAKNPHAVEMGRLGGKACGPTKARRVSSDAARAAVRVRWERHRAAKELQQLQKNKS
jgi:hypothetical protein